MPSALRLKFAVEAEDDIQQILQYTLETWGEEQFARYSAELERAFDLLSHFPNLGNSRLAGGIRSNRMHQHVIYYSVEGDILMIRRVLHQRQDVREIDIPDPPS